MPATFIKLKDGAWGLQVIGEKPRVGDSLLVDRRDGSQESKIVDRVLWSKNDVHLCSIRGSAAKRGKIYECGECGEYVTPGTKCWETGVTH